MVAKIMPKLNEIAIGMTNWACKLVSSMIGINPAAVVSDVSIIGRNRSAPDNRTASFADSPDCLALFTKSMRIRLSFTTTPARAIKPNSENILIATPIRMCPNTAPMSPNGMTDMMIMG